MVFINLSVFFENLSRSFPFLGPSLKAARINMTPYEYTRKSFLSSLYVSGFIALAILLVAMIFEVSGIIALLFFVTFFFFFLFYFINTPRLIIIKSEKLVEAEIVSAVRFLVLELRSERSVYNALINTSKNFSLIGIYFDEIINNVKLGTTLEKALNDAVELCPSPHLRHVYWQLLNSLQTGADITEALENLLDNIVEEQGIKVEEYGRELNALSLFYMMIAIIIPTIGFTIITAIMTFIGFHINLPLLIIVWLVLSFVQYFFLMIASNRRPSVEAY